MTDRDAVLAANDAFYRAFESLDPAEMEKVWLRAPHIRCIHPGWGALVGWDAIMESWQRIFAGAVEMRFTQELVHVAVTGDLGWVVLVERIASLHPDGPGGGRVQATNLFERVDGAWYLVHHHGSPIYEDVPRPSGPLH
jgi:ketosteroid isomerase-like protein